ncbi:hypothetical protein COHA_002627 [Chlorella ohadii]|uniref:Uncharacterized protein n=1 Tax=Chlorella ohadii TaxID=2649997 RepID=A0AAD5DWJ1_9CHLO|nr:hypothetical protein COHA_002627 [Chlorella ohadii]
MVICPFCVPCHLLFRSDWDTLAVTPLEPTVGMSPAPSLEDKNAVSPANSPTNSPLRDRKVTVSGADVV